MLKIGSGKVNALVFSQILPLPPEEIFFEQMLGPFLEKFTFTILDSLDSQHEKYFHGFLGDVFFGFSYGSCILQKHCHLPQYNDKKFIFISGFTHASQKLKTRLSPVIDKLSEKQTFSACEELNSLVSSDPVSSTLKSFGPYIQKRLTSGFESLFQFNAVEEVKERKNSMLYLIGENSKLISKSDIDCGNQHYVKTVSNAGMRLLNENKERSTKEILSFLRSKGISC